MFNNRLEEDKENYFVKMKQSDDEEKIEQYLSSKKINFEFISALL